MALEIEIITVGAGEQVLERRTAPGQFSTVSEANEAAGKLAKGYPAHGYDDEQGFWWARDNAREHRFIVRGAGGANVLDNPDLLSDKDILKG